MLPIYLLLLLKSGIIKVIEMGGRKMYKVSVLIPCYNTEEYLSRCLDSVISQTYKNLEIVLLDDGSTDNSLNIMKEYQAKDDRITIISRENRGIATSRNELIEKSTGEYASFVDSDDYISNDYISSMMEAIEKSNSDIALCGVKKVYDNTTNERITTETIHVSDRIETLKAMISVRDYYDYPVAKLYNRKCIQNVRFPDGRIYEDTATLFKIYNNIDRAVILDKECYFYLIGREGSITTKKYTKKNLNDNYLAIHDRYEFILEKVPEIKNEICLCYINNAIVLVQRALLTNDNEIMNSEIVKKVYGEIKQIYPLVKDCSFINEYIERDRMGSLFFILNDINDLHCQFLKFVNNI